MCQWVKLNKCSIEKKNIFLSDKLSENYISCGILITLAKVFELSVICTTLNTHLIFGSVASFQKIINSLYSIDSFTIIRDCVCSFQARLFFLFNQHAW